MAIDSSENLLFNAPASLKNINIPAITPKIGAVKKSLAGDDIGGAWSADKPFKSTLVSLNPTQQSYTPSSQQFYPTRHLDVVVPSYKASVPLSYCAVALEP